MNRPLNCPQYPLIHLHSHSITMLLYFLIVYVKSVITQPMGVPPFYPGYPPFGYSPYGGTPQFPQYPTYPYGLAHFGTQSTYQQPFNQGFNQPFNPYYNQGFQSSYQMPLTYEVNGATSPLVLEHAGFLSLVNDKDNFQPQGCGWDAVQNRCTDGLGLCKGGCRDFATTTQFTTHDCRCIPYGYAALLKLIG